MHLTDYPDTAATIDATPRTNASQEVAAAHRARATDPERETTPAVVRQYAPIALIAAAVLLIGVLSYGLSRTPVRPLQLPPTAVPQPTESARMFVSPSEKSPAPRTAPLGEKPTPDMPSPPAPPPQPAQSGRGLGIVEAAPEPQAAPTYLEVVGAQAPHSPRGGLCGPTGGDCAPGVPYGLDNSQYLANVGAQKPHKVR